MASSADGSTLFLSSSNNGCIYVSRDGGYNWAASASAYSKEWRIIVSSDDGSSVVAANYGGYIYTSNDYGINWVSHEEAGTRV